MSVQKKELSRRKFIAETGKVAAGTLLFSAAPAVFANRTSGKKLRLAMVGTGHRGNGMWGKTVIRDYKDYVQFVGICDINPGRVKFARKYIGAQCPTYTDFDKMMREAKPEMLIVTTVDSTHHEFIVKGLEYGCDIVTEKPMTTDETKCASILDAERRSNKNVIVTFNYRYSPHRRKIKEMLLEDRIGRVTSVDFHWYLNEEHGSRYFRRWHGLRKNSGTLLVHKATHHFDLLNWWLDSDPEEIFAYGDLEYYGRNNPFRSTHCRVCKHKNECQFYYDITENDHFMKMYVENEKYDGYLRDSCIWRKEIDIYDKHAVQIKYANNVFVSYSLTTYSPYEGYRIAFNGTKGRLEAWIQEKQRWPKKDFDEIRVTDFLGDTQLIKASHGGGGHGGGDIRLKDKIFKDPGMQDPFKQSAGTRDGAMSILIGIAARKSIESKMPVKIADLTDIVPQAKRPV